MILPGGGWGWDQSRYHHPRCEVLWSPMSPMNVYTITCHHCTFKVFLMYHEAPIEIVVPYSTNKVCPVAFESHPKNDAKTNQLYVQCIFMCHQQMWQVLCWFNNSPSSFTSKVGTSGPKWLDLWGWWNLVVDSTWMDPKHGIFTGNNETTLTNFGSFG